MNKQTEIKQYKITFPQTEITARNEIEAAKMTKSLMIHYIMTGEYFEPKVSPVRKKRKKVLDKYIPNVGKPKYTNLAALWKVCVREVLNANGINQQFIIGFTFDSNTVANHSMKNGVSCYMINPNSSVIDEGTKQEKVMSILTTAVHEVVHSQGCQYHDENFVLKFHDLLLPTLTKAPTWRKLVKMAKTEKV